MPTLNDASTLYKLRNNSQVLQYIERKPLNDEYEAVVQVDKLIRNTQSGEIVYWIICSADSNELLGTICLWNFQDIDRSAEIGYELFPKFHGKGIMSEAMEAVINYAYDEVHVQIIEAFTHKENSPSRRMLEKHGFIRQEDRTDDKVPSNCIYALTASKFKKSE